MLEQINLLRQLLGGKKYTVKPGVDIHVGDEVDVSVRQSGDSLVVTFGEPKPKVTIDLTVMGFDVGRTTKRINGFTIRGNKLKPDLDGVTGWLGEKEYEIG